MFLRRSSLLTTVSVCFSIFAGIAVIANYLLMLTWFPASVIVFEQSCFSKPDFYDGLWVCYQRWCCAIIPWDMSWGRFIILKTIWMNKEKYLLEAVLKFRYLWFISMFLLAILGACIVLVYPKLQLPDSPEFQLFTSSHPFEQYDFQYKRLFWFNNPERVSHHFHVANYTKNTFTESNFNKTVFRS